MNDNENNLNMKVQNEYERVLANPANVIMSEELEGLLSPSQTEEITPGCIVISSISESGEAIKTKVNCSFRAMMKIGDLYRIELQLVDPTPFMRVVSTLGEGFSISVNDDMQLKIENCQLDSWDVFKDVDSFNVGLGVKGEVQF